MSVYKILVGGYSTVITTLLFNPSSSSLSVLSTSPAGLAPSWIAAHPTNKSVVYASQEFNSPGEVWSFSVGSSGQLTKASRAWCRVQPSNHIASASTGGGGPAHLIATSDGNEIIATNYVGGSAVNIPLTADKGHFGPAYPGITFNGSGPNPNRQEGPHPHQVVENGSEYLVPDLGADKVWRLTKSSSGALQNSGYIQQPAGSGPRHIVVKGNTLYTLHELSNTLIQQTIPPLGSSTQPPVTSSISIVPSDSSNPSAMSAAELLISPVSSAYPTQYLYATNRGDSSDAIAIIGTAGTALNLVTQCRTGLKQIRGAAFSPGDGKYLAVAGQGDGGVVVYERINGGADLKEVARISGLTTPTSFLWL